MLDTNILSESLKSAPAHTVMRWLAAQDSSPLYTSAVSQAEIPYGVEALPPSRRKDRIRTAIERIFAEEFGDWILPFDPDAPHAFAGIVIARRAVGRPISQLDAMIAAISRSHRAAVACRNTAYFEGCGIAVINPSVG